MKGDPLSSLPIRWSQATPKKANTVENKIFIKQYVFVLKQSSHGTLSIQPGKNNNVSAPHLNIRI